MVVVVAKLKAKPDQGDVLQKALVDMVEWVTENESDTLTYICNRSVKDPDQFIFFERYPNQAAFDAHSSSDRFAEFFAELQGLLGAPVEIEVLEEVAAKL